ncbi:bifunctional DNA primase/polymerase [Actinomadura macrotermitis]|uniref:DNA primase/polymerase bifunctional N-terminal domain-containing protein n=1 Tax=Actinomadura macrotermitis TaxID=2585200 RepID=A0A7K0C366_9ACTN|nr:bifunctional DNA primase/polymerase [Actinomadura macrotermitis]MQY07264.1 hypothetical protein [Actinomadura macrotermitis]
MINLNQATVPAVQLALDLAAIGWHVFPLSPRDKRPLANCLHCRDNPTCSRDDYAACPCLPAGQWCHGVRAATTDPDRIRTWWRRTPTAVPAVAAGPSGLVLIDLDNHAPAPPADPATELLPGFTLTAEQLHEPSAVRTGADVLRLLAHLRGGPHPWPTGPGHQPIAVATPSGGRHLWYRAPQVAGGGRLRQALSELGWQIDIKAGWNYGIAPGAAAPAGAYRVLTGTPAAPGHMPDWLAREVLRVATDRPTTSPARLPAAPATGQEHRAAAYIAAVIESGAAELASLTDGRQRALSALAYKAGGLLSWSGLSRGDIEDRLIHAGLASGLPDRLARRIVDRALANGLASPLPAPGDRKAG